MCVAESFRMTVETDLGCFRHVHAERLDVEGSQAADWTREARLANTVRMLSLCEV